MLHYNMATLHSRYPDAHISYNRSSLIPTRRFRVGNHAKPRLSATAFVNSCEKVSRAVLYCLGYIQEPYIPMASGSSPHESRLRMEGLPYDVNLNKVSSQHNRFIVFFDGILNEHTVEKSYKALTTALVLFHRRCLIGHNSLPIVTSEKLPLRHLIALIRRT